MNIIRKYIEKNDCYKANKNRADSRYRTFQDEGPKGLVLHSVGCAQPSALVFANRWNQANYQVAVHAVLQPDGTVYQCLPWNYRGWHVGGSANNTHIGVEMTEPACLTYGSGGRFTCSDLPAAKAHAKACYETAVLLFAKLCREYSLDPQKDGVIISHKEAAKRGVGSDHGDPEHLWNGLGLDYNMNKFRSAVKAEIDRQIAAEEAARQAAEAQLDNKPAAWSKKAVEWATGNGLLVGDNRGDLMLRQPLTREQFCVVLKRYDEMKQA